MIINVEADNELARLVPHHLIGGIHRYFEDRIRPGSFLCAVLTNNLSDAVKKGDMESLVSLISIVRWLQNFAPEESWGSVEALERWLAEES